MPSGQIRAVGVQKKAGGQSCLEVAISDREEAELQQLARWISACRAAGLSWLIHGEG